MKEHFSPVPEDVPYHAALEQKTGAQGSKLTSYAVVNDPE
jgi:hypothetical protein